MRGQRPFVMTNLKTKQGLAEVIEFKRWLKSFGEKAVVLRPDWLRKEMHEELLATAARYES